MTRIVRKVAELRRLRRENAVLTEVLHDERESRRNLWLLGLQLAAVAFGSGVGFALWWSR